MLKPNEMSAYQKFLKKLGLFNGKITGLVTTDFYVAWEGFSSKYLKYSSHPHMHRIIPTDANTHIKVMDNMLMEAPEHVRDAFETLKSDIGSNLDPVKSIKDDEKSIEGDMGVSTGEKLTANTIVGVPGPEPVLITSPEQLINTFGPETSQTDEVEKG